jgi:multidrug efflux pump subunit AcrA (membrane-fusion protein)
MKVYRTTVFFAITAAGAFLSISGCSSGGGQNVMVSAPAEPAKPGITLACPGRVEGRSETFEVGAGADGLVKAVYVKEGQHVARGTKLAEIDCPDLQASFEEAKSQTESARQVKARVMRGSRDEERLSAEQRTVAAKAVLEEAAAHMKRMKELHDSGVMARADLDSVKRDYDVAEAKLREAIRNEELVKAPALAEEVAKADSDIASAEHRMEIVQEKMSKCVVTAPINGAILRVLMKSGESFSTLTPRPLFTMADLSVRRIRAEVDERDVSKLRVGKGVDLLRRTAESALAGGSGTDLRHHGPQKDPHRRPIGEGRQGCAGSHDRSGCRDQTAGRNARYGSIPGNEDTEARSQACGSQASPGAGYHRSPCSAAGPTASRAASERGCAARRRRGASSQRARPIAKGTISRRH